MSPRTPLLTALALALAIAVPVRAQPDMRELEASLEQLAGRAGNETLPISRRHEARDQAIQLRRALLERFPDHERAPEWRLDLAADLLTRLSRHALDTTALFGLPTEEARAETERVAREVLTLVDVEPDASARPRRELLRARAACILASLAEDPTLSAELAREALGAARAVELRGDAERLRAVCEAWALDALAEPGPARDLAAAALDAGQPRDAIRFELQFTLARAEAALGEGPAALARLDALRDRLPVASVPGGNDTPDVLVLAEAWARIAARDPRTRGRLFELALRLLDDPTPRAIGGARSDALRASIARIARRFPDAMRPPRVRLELALQRSPDDPSAALPELDALADDADDPEVVVEALWTAAAIRLREEDPAARLTAVETFVRIAREHPQSPRVSQALGHALAWGRELASAESAPARAAALYDEALALLDSADVPDRDAWLYERARRQSERDDPAAWLDALDTLELIDADSEARPAADRLYESVASRLIALESAARRDLREAGRTDLLESNATELVSLCRRAIERCEAGGLEAAARRFRADLAEAMLELGRTDPAVIAADLLPHAAQIPGGEARLRLIRGRALHLAGDPEAAFAELRRVTELLPRPPTGENGPADARARAYFWHAWTLLVEILEGQNHGGTRTGAIRARLAWLRQIDPNLGNEPWRARLERVQERVNR